MVRRVPTHRSTRPGTPAGRPRDNTEWRRFLNTIRWRKLSKWYLSENPCCIRCLARGDLVQAVHTHHTRGQDPAHAMDPATFEALCNPCHGAAHAPGEAQLINAST